jgi:glycosyl transferase family 2
MAEARRTIGVAIPSYAAHIQRLPALLASIEQQTCKPEQVVVSCSGSVSADLAHLRLGWSFPLSILSHGGRKNAAQNRNLAARALGTDIVSFCDADDVMHPQRLEIIGDTFAATGADVVLHGFLSPPSPEYAAPFQPYDKPWRYAVNPTHLTLDDYLAYVPPPICSHVSLTRDVAKRHRFPESLSFERREDSELVGELLARPDIRSAHIAMALTKYECAGSWVGAPAGSGVYELGGAARLGRSIGALPGMRSSKAFILMQSMWRALPVSWRARFMK